MMRLALAISMALVLALSPLARPRQAGAAAAAEIDANVKTALEHLYAKNAVAKILAETAVGVLVFPDVVKGGLPIGGQFGEGVLVKGSAVAGYYRTIAASYGLQAGTQSFGYALFFMNDAAPGYIFFDQKGLMAGIGIQGSKITKIEPGEQRS